jgi:hypothetical protein
MGTLVGVVLWVFVGLGVLQGLAFLYDQWYFRRETKREEEEMGCDCPTPKSYTPFGSTFVCPECARKWYSTHDNVAWAGWTWAPLWKRIQIKLGWDRRKYEDPMPHSELAKQLQKESWYTVARWVLAARERAKNDR